MSSCRTCGLLNDASPSSSLEGLRERERDRPESKLRSGERGLGGRAKVGLSASGGGVGGNKFRCMGGSDCCRVLVDNPGRTRFVAAKERLFKGLSSLAQ